VIQVLHTGIDGEDRLFAADGRGGHLAQVGRGRDAGSAGEVNAITASTSQVDGAELRTCQGDTL
jgi:hypothetical protein